MKKCRSFERSCNFFLLLGLGLISFPAFVSAQTPVDILTHPKSETKSEEVEAKPMFRRVFSSELKNIAQAEKLDLLYQEAADIIWQIALEDKTHQKMLMDQMVAEKFKYSRRLSEFKKPMDMAMKDLNRNNKIFNQEFDAVLAKFAPLKAGFNDEAEVAEKLWNKKTEELRTLSTEYFKSQNKYLNLYNKIVAFILERSGTYYYNSELKRVYFYNIEDYNFFGKGIDSLNKISFEQRRSLREIAPLEESE